MKTGTQRTALSFDGHGVNDYDEYGSRIATLTDRYKDSKYGPLFAAAPDMLEALTECLEAFALVDEFVPTSATQATETLECAIKCAIAAIAKAQGE